MGGSTRESSATAIAKELQKRHEGCEVKYTFCENQGCFEACLLKCFVRDGEVVSIDVGDTINANNPREDLGDEAIRTGMLQCRPCVRGRAMKHTLGTTRAHAVPDEARPLSARQQRRVGAHQLGRGHRDSGL